jgi:hypothetical protein
MDTREGHGCSKLTLVKACTDNYCSVRTVLTHKEAKEKIQKRLAHA